ncbi:hypothetical protein FD03_GL000065 [Companilactobacillus nodensis DSM 19682 = JCM 14932 = NBRC 107160]|uniref:Uncharacterized protein n=1 Tax=Companilactobacillus nodensis DSM 19682 = JCM 14932 = NBRC 107160 TaxID=1423775 RepID=A0A0R1KEI4_9LACO|nr:hypothetical protein FD03_GL000065 [Companilactobacillus nodensis DSM 19682 = JCM 14932 = NBRC 107160]
MGKIMYGGQEFGGSQMLESGTILLLLDINNKDWAKRRLGLEFYGLAPGDSITCKAFGVEKDWKNVSQIRVYVDNHDPEIIDISELKNGPCDVGNKDLTLKLEGNEFTFKNNGHIRYESILVEAYNE